MLGHDCDGNLLDGIDIGAESSPNSRRFATGQRGHRQSLIRSNIVKLEMTVPHPVPRPALGTWVDRIFIRVFRVMASRGD